MNPNTLARTLVGDAGAMTYAKQIRGRLRSWYPRAPELKGSNWALTDEHIHVIRSWHKARQSGKAFDFDATRKAYRTKVAAAKAKKPKAVTNDAPEV